MYCRCYGAYLSKTKASRKIKTSLFVSYNEPHKGVGVDTITRLPKTAMKDTSIDTSIFA